MMTATKVHTWVPPIGINDPVMRTARTSTRWVPPPGGTHGRMLAAARWQMFVRMASELVAEQVIETWEYKAHVHQQWADAGLPRNNSGLAERDREVAAACRERAELVRRYPEDFTDTLAVLAEIFGQGVAA